jgi:hypothetical protein
MSAKKKIWFCKIGETSRLPSYGGDGPMRVAVAQAYRELTGERPLFCFSGWDGELSEPERAVVENREPQRNWSRNEIVAALAKTNPIIPGTISGGHCFFCGASTPRGEVVHRPECLWLDAQRWQ